MAPLELREQMARDRIMAITALLVSRLARQQYLMSDEMHDRLAKAIDDLAACLRERQK